MGSMESQEPSPLEEKSEERQGQTQGQVKISEDVMQLVLKIEEWAMTIPIIWEK
jgi:hypothetical protein